MWSPSRGLCALIRRDLRELPRHSHQVRAQQDGAVTQEEGPLRAPVCRAWVPAVGCRTGRHPCVLLKPPGYGTGPRCRDAVRPHPRHSHLRPCPHSPVLAAGDLGDHRERHGHPQCLSFSQPTPSHPAKPQVLWSQPRPQFSRLSAPPHSQLCGQSPLASAFAVPAGVFRGPSLTTPTGPVKPEPASARRPPRSSLQHTSCPVTPLHGNPVPRRLPVRDALS